jgi:peptidoglycan/LPS O-acetylase OafA/YrhL
MTGTWAITEVHFYRFIGGESVILFFMITSFLYWSKAISQKGNMRIFNLYKNRLLRLAPMYLFSALVVTTVLLTNTGCMVSNIIQFIRDVLSWLTLGIITTLSVNGESVIPVNAGIHWTLHFEWIFYLILPALAVILRGKWMYLLAVPIFALLMLSSDKGYWIIFVFGILLAHIIHIRPQCKWITKQYAGILPVLGFIAVYFIQLKPYSVPQYAITCAVLLCFIYGNNLFGLLHTRAAKLLGTISYSVYLLHGIVLYFTINIVNQFKYITEVSALGYWCVMLIAGFLTVSLSLVTYRYIEYPFLKKG